jgi:hypothetical protein
MNGCQPAFPRASSLTPAAEQPSAKRFHGIKGHEVAHDVGARPCQCVGDGLPCQGRVVVAFGQCALRKSLRARVKAARKLGGLHRRPAQIRMPIFAIALPCALAMADFGTLHAAAIRRVVAHRREAMDIAGFQWDRLRSNRADALDCQQLLVRGCVVQTLMDTLCQGFDLVAQAVQDREAARDGQDVGGLGQHARELLLRELANPFETETRTCMAYQDILYTEHIGRVLTYEVRALPP